MRSYFTASVVGKKYYLENYLSIIKILNRKKIKVIADHIIHSTEDKIRLITKEERIDFQKKLEKWITSSDFLLAETSFPSISVGYEISLARNLGKPVLILYANGDPPSLLAYSKDDKIVCEKYTTDTVKGIIDDFINYIKGVSYNRFTFSITGKMASFLEEIQKEQKVPKSVYLRTLIENDMVKNVSLS